MRRRACAASTDGLVSLSWSISHVCVLEARLTLSRCERSERRKRRRQPGFACDQGQNGYDIIPGPVTDTGGRLEEIEFVEGRCCLVVDDGSERGEG